MYKTKLQVLCQQNSWDLPEYSTTRDGPDHNSRFTATVTVKGLHFKPSDQSRSTKEAQNKAAKLAFDHFSAPNRLHCPSPSQSSPLSVLPNRPISTSSSGVSSSVTPRDIKPSTDGTLQPDTREPMAISLMNETERGVKDDKEAQNKAVKLAFSHSSTTNALPYPNLSQPSPLSPLPDFPISTWSSGVSSSVTTRDIKPSTEGTLQPDNIESMAIPLMNETETGVQDDKVFIDVRHSYKNRLHTYVLKRNLTLPMYSCDREGPPHACRFKSKVTIAGKTYESLGFFSTIKEADHAAAKVALESLSLKEVQEDDSALYKNFLQELAQKGGWNAPKYETTVSGPAHSPIFFSIVEIKGQTFQGQGAKNKKQAEMSAAKVAYTNLQESQKNKDEEGFSCSGSLSVKTPVIHDSQMTGYKNKDEERVACIESLPVRMPGRGGIIPTHLPSGSQIKEALKATSSVLQSVITGDSQQNTRLKSNLISEEQEDKCTDGNVEFSSKFSRLNTEVGTSRASEEKILPKMMTMVDAEVGARPACIQPPEADINAKRYRCSPSSDIGYAQRGDLLPMTSSLPEDGDSSSSTRSECSANSHISSSNEPTVSGTNTVTRERILVYPRDQNLTFPEGATVLPYSDDKWVAFKMNLSR
ncbi:hypothetical protein NMG60_11008730 [Bertholletia excelsa]